MKQIPAMENAKCVHRCPTHGLWGHDNCGIGAGVDGMGDACPLCIGPEDGSGPNWWLEDTFENWVAEVRNNRVRD